MNRVVSFIHFLCLALFIASSTRVVGANTIIYDAGLSFGPSNPNGQWSYGWNTSLGGSMTVYPNYGIEYLGYYAWYDLTISADTPNVIEPAGATLFGHTYAPNELAIDPGQAQPIGQYSIIRWTAPDNGTVLVTAAFAGGNVGASEVFVYKNVAQLYDYGISGYAVAPTFNESLSVQAGDTIDFAVGLTPAGGSTAVVAAEIAFTPVPEPSAVVLLSMGGGALLLCRCRKRVNQSRGTRDPR